MTDAAAGNDMQTSGTGTPLIRVLSQIRWPLLSDFDVDAVGRSLAQRIGGTYPLRAEGEDVQITLTPDGVTRQLTGKLHRFMTADKTRAVTLSETFVTLETSAYTGHEDFIGRLAEVVSALMEVKEIAAWERFGYRYTNRLTQDGGNDELSDLFVPGIVGTAGLGHDLPLTQGVSESVYTGPDASLLVRTAYLPAGATIEPNIAPVSSTSWMLDLDAFVLAAPGESMTTLDVSARATLLSKHAHDFFERVKTDAYRRRFS